MKKLLFLLLLPLWVTAQVSTGQEQEFDTGIKNNSAPTVSVPNYITTQGADGTYGKIEPVNLVISTATQTALDLKENISNKSTDFSTVNNTLYPSVQAVKIELDLKAPIASPTFTGTVSGITKAMVGLSNVDNTSDANKNVNSANLWNSYSDASHDANLGYMMGYNGTTSKFSYYGISTVKTWLEGAGTWGINISGSSTNWGTAGNTYIEADNGNSNYIMVTTGGTGQWKYRSIADFRSDLGSGDMVLASAQTNTGVKTFLDGTLGLRNVANTFTSYFTNTNTASRTYTLPDASGIVALISPVTETGTSFSLTDAYNGKVVILTASCTVTIPNGLIAGFECSFVTLAGVTQTIALGGSVVLFNNVGTTMAEKLSFTLKNRTATNNYITVGSL